MNSEIHTFSTSQLSSATAYTIPSLTGEKGMPLHLSYKSFSSSIMKVDSAANTTNEELTFLKPPPLAEDSEIEEFLHFLDSFESDPEAQDNITAE